MKWIHRFFDFINKIQLLYAKLRINLYKLQNSSIYKTFKKWYYIVTFITIIILIASSYFKNQILSSIFGIIFLVLFFIFPLIKVLLNCLTSIRYFILVSIVLNVLTSIFIFSNNIILSLLLFFLVYIFLSILANTDVAIIVNTIIEFILTLFTITRDIVIDLLDFIYNELLKHDLIKEANIYLNNLNINEYEFKISMDMVLFPLLLINGIGLLVAVLHSYWIKKYNKGSELQLINFEDEDFNDRNDSNA